MRYNRGDIGDTMRAAQRHAAADRKVVYVYARGGGYAIESQRDAFGQAGFSIAPSGAWLRIGGLQPIQPR